MKGFEKIVVGMDLGARGERLTPGSELALDRALWLAPIVGARVTLLHATAPDEYWEPDSGFVASPGRLPEAGEKQLEAAAERCRDAGLETYLVRSSETAWMALVHQVLREGSDLVIAGKRTDVASDDRKLGSVAMKLLRKCPCAVWLVDPRHDHPPATLLAATDLGDVGRSVVELAGAFAAALGAKLHVVHAFSLPLSIQMEGEAAEAEHDRRMRLEARAEIERALAASGLQGKAELHIGLSSPSRAILDCVEHLRPDLVVMGTVSRGGLPGLLIGNTAERLLHHLDCGVLAIKPDDFITPVEL